MGEFARAPVAAARRAARSGLWPGSLGSRGLSAMGMNGGRGRCKGTSLDGATRSGPSGERTGANPRVASGRASGSCQYREVLKLTSRTLASAREVIAALACAQPTDPNNGDPKQEITLPFSISCMATMRLVSVRSCQNICARGQKTRPWTEGEHDVRPRQEDTEATGRRTEVRREKAILRRRAAWRAR
jgi:hypothetical protein